MGENANTKKPKLFITRALPPAVEDRAKRDYDAITQNEGAVLSARDIINKSANCDAILTCPADPINGETIKQLNESIKIIATFSVGFEHVDLDAATTQGIPVTNTPDVLTDATADVALLLILGATRRAAEGMKLIAENKWTGWTPTQLMGSQIGGKRLGVLGMGRIGQATADRARAFGMEIHYHNRSRLSPELEKGAVYHDSAEGLLAVSDVLSIHCPLTPETNKFLNATRIAMLPKGAVVINTARGPVIDDDALINALKTGHISAAGLDVFAGEPKLNVGYTKLDNVFLLPHLGSATIETRNAMGFKALDNLDAFFAGREIPNRVN
ncbi:MAG: D-glycerate dehydrogenase [Rhodospirillaceae bacterium]|nr:D-glycerate dehydrogenase [Rhodospirillaceae bacterium]